MSRPLRVFLCHASQDKPAVRGLSKRLKSEGWIDPWLDEEKLSFGQHWTTAIEDAIHDADIVIIFLSHNSVQKEGFIQRELNYAWELSLEKPRHVIFLIPFRLDDVEIPRFLASRQWGDYFDEKKESTYLILLRSLKKRHEQKLAMEAEEHARIEDAEKKRKQKEEERKRDLAEAEAEKKRLAEEIARREKAEREAKEKAARNKKEQEKADKISRDILNRKIEEEIIQENIQLEETKKANFAKAARPTLRPYGIGAVIFLVAIFGIFGINSLMKNVEVTPSQTREPVVDVSPTGTESILTNTIDVPTITRTPFQPLDAPIITPTPELGIGSTMISEKDGMTLVYVPAGEFLMGSDANDAIAECQKFKPDCQRDWYIASEPPHTVHLDAFWIDRTEVTNAMYAKCADAGICVPPSQTKSYTHYSYYGNPEFGNYPVVYVDWFMAKNYCEWGERRLPTEAEWEKAARSTNASIYPWGNEVPSKNLLNYKWADSGDTTEVGIYPRGASPYGVLDMSGNASEWVSSLYQAYPYNANDGRESGSASGNRVLRGGGWDHIEPFVFSFSRSGNDPTDSNNNSGFRCAHSQ